MKPGLREKFEEKYNIIDEVWEIWNNIWTNKGGARSTGIWGKFNRAWSGHKGLSENWNVVNEG
jgi:hypothetical protein